MNLAEALAVYNSIPAGVFGALVINAYIDNAVEALASGDVVKMAQAYDAMKDSE